MMQGDAYSVPVVIKAKDGTVITPEMVTRVEITIGHLTRQWPGVITFNEDTLAWEFPLTQQQSFRLSQGKQKTQVRVAFSNGWVVGGDGTDVRVLKSESKSILPAAAQQEKTANIAFGAIFTEIGAITVVLGAELPEISESTKGQYLTNDGTEAKWADVEALPEMSAATKGQYLTNDGEKAEWAEPAQSDWSQNDSSKPDYIKNRTHYVGMDSVEVVPETEFTIKDVGNFSTIETSAVVSIGDVCVVVFDGETYTQQVKDAGNGNAYAGNMSLAVPDGDDSGEPFLIAFPSELSSAAIMVKTAGTHTIAIKVTTDVVHTLDHKFIKDMYYSENVVKEIAGVNGYEATAAYTESKIIQKVSVAGTIYENLEPNQSGSHWIYVAGEHTLDFYIGSLIRLTITPNDISEDEVVFFKDDVVYHPVPDQYIPKWVANIADIVNADWNETNESFKSFIKNKPEIPPVYTFYLSTEADSIDIELDTSAHTAFILVFYTSILYGVEKVPVRSFRVKHNGSTSNYYNILSGITLSKLADREAPYSCMVVYFNYYSDRQGQAFCLNSIQQSPVAKTDEMTQSVGLDAETGELWTAPAAGGDESLGITSASVGQLIKVQEVDADGKPTKWKAVDDRLPAVGVTEGLVLMTRRIGEFDYAYVLGEIDNSSLGIYTAKPGQFIKVQSLQDGEEEIGAPLEWTPVDDNFTPMVVNITPDDSGTLSADKTFAEILAACQIGRPVKAKFDTVALEMPLAEYTTTQIIFRAPQFSNNQLAQYAQIVITETEVTTSALSVPSSDNTLGITSATVGQIAKITAVDTEGKPTEWEAVDMPSGGSDEWELIQKVTIADSAEESNRLTINADKSGNPFSLKRAKIYGYFPAYTGESTIPTYSFFMLNGITTVSDGPYCYTSGWVVPQNTTITFCSVDIDLTKSGLQSESVSRSRGATGIEYFGPSHINTITSIGGTNMLIYPGCRFELYGVRA